MPGRLKPLRCAGIEARRDLLLDEQGGRDNTARSEAAVPATRGVASGERPKAPKSGEVVVAHPNEK